MELNEHPSDHNHKTRLEELLCNRVGIDLVDQITDVLYVNPTELADWMKTNRILFPVEVWQLSAPPERSHSKHGPLSAPKIVHVFKDPEQHPPDFRIDYMTVTRLYAVKGL